MLFSTIIYSNSQQVRYLHNIAASAILVVSQKRIFDLHGDYLRTLCKGRAFDLYLLPNHESHKTMETWLRCLKYMVKQNYDRELLVIAFGGGMVGDIAGFAASCFMRGVRLIQVPTTLLAQVDSAIGGKNGVNLPAGKNLIGTFYQPTAILIQPRWLTTLPDREYRSGLAEIVKYGLIYDKKFFYWFRKNLSGLLQRDPLALQKAIKKSVSIKVAITTKDERDLGLRNLLNFGHTFGHALEMLTDYKRLLHGEAVAIGMMLAATLSHHLHFISAKELSSIDETLQPLIPHKLQFSFSFADLIQQMQKDKKTLYKKIRLILLAGIGEGKIVDGLSTKQMNLLEDFELHGRKIFAHV